MIDYRKQFWVDLETKKYPHSCEWCGKEELLTWGEGFDHGMYHVLCGHEKKFPRPEQPKTVEICSKCGQERKE